MTGLVSLVKALLLISDIVISITSIINFVRGRLG